MRIMIVDQGIVTYLRILCDICFKDIKDKEENSILHHSKTWLDHETIIIEFDGTLYRSHICRRCMDLRIRVTNKKDKSNFSDEIRKIENIMYNPAHKLKYFSKRFELLDNLYDNFRS